MTGEARRVAANTEAIDAVIAAVMRIDEATGGDGLSSFLVHVDTRGLTVWWVGEVPRELTRLGQTSDVHVEIRPGRFPQAKLESAMSDLDLAWRRQYPQGLNGFQVVSVGLAVDGSGLNVGVSFADPRSTGAPPRVPESVIAAVNALVVEVPVLSVEPQEGGRALAAVVNRG